jgi:predicted nuclease of predicted toxin-antitoxin system
VALLKLDENLPDLAGDVLRDAGHDVALARDEGLAGAADDELLAVAVSEGRALVTMDLDFSDVRRHPPADASGIVVLRLHDQTLPGVQRAAGHLAGLLSREPLQGHLWILDESRLRIWPGTPERL